MGSEKPVFVDAVLGEQRSQTLAVIRLDASAKLVSSSAKERAAGSGVLIGLWPGSRLAPASKARRKVATAPSTAALTPAPVSVRFEAQQMAQLDVAAHQRDELLGREPGIGEGQGARGDRALAGRPRSGARWRSGPARQNTSPSAGKRVTSPRMIRCKRDRVGRQHELEKTAAQHRQRRADVAGVEFAAPKSARNSARTRARSPRRRVLPCRRNGHRRSPSRRRPRARSCPC